MSPSRGLAPIDKRLSASMLLSSALSKSKGSFAANYDIVDSTPLARGAFALVWRCKLRKATSGMMYVVKSIERSRLQKVDHRNLFGANGRDGEIRLHSKLIHPNIVRLISVYEEPDTVSVVLESCLGGDLFEHISSHRRTSSHSGGVSAAGAAACMRQLLGALTFLHTASIVHRDVKSENVLLYEKDIKQNVNGVPLERNTFKLADFGFAVCLKQVSGGQLYTVMGSPSTVAPEVLNNQPYGTPADLWSSGVVLYNLLSATQPFKAPTPREIMKKVRAGQYGLEGAPWDSIDEDAKDLLKGLMCFDVEKRLRAPEAMLHSFLVPDFVSTSSRSTLRSSGRPVLPVKAKIPSLSRSLTGESIAEDDSTSPKFLETGLHQAFESARSSRLPSMETITTEASAADSEYGLSEWQISSVRKASESLLHGTPAERNDGTQPAPANSTLTRVSRMTSKDSEDSFGDSPFGLSDKQILAKQFTWPTTPTSCPVVEEVETPSESTDEPRSATDQANTSPDSMPDLQALDGHETGGATSSALDVLGARLQEARNCEPTPKSRDTSVCTVDMHEPTTANQAEETIQEGEEAVEEEEEDPENLSPFIYTPRRHIADVYSDQFMDPYAKGRGCCGSGGYGQSNRTWWEKLFF